MIRGLTALSGVAIVAGMLGWAALVQPEQRAPAAPGDKPNILVYMIDTLRADELGCYGAAVTKTPAIDRFARQGVVFVNAHSAAPATRPSIASFFTGVASPAHGLEKNLVGFLPKEPGGMPRAHELLRAQGYYTVGIVANPNVDAFFGFARGWDAYHGLYERKPLPGQPAPRSDDLVTTADMVVDRVREEIDKAPRDKPFYLFVLSIDPHDPYTPPAPYDTMYDKDADAKRDGSINVLQQQFDAAVKAGRPPTPTVERIRALYRGEVSFADEQFGRLLDWMAERGILDRTLVALTADHGEEFLEHGRRGHGHTLFQEQLRVPLVLRHPALFQPGRIDEPVSLLDLSATLVLAGGASKPDYWTGRDLRQGVRPATIFAAQNSVDGLRRAVRFGNEKLIRDEKSGQQDAYDLIADPGELHPMQGDAKRRADRALGAQLRKFQEANKAILESYARHSADAQPDRTPDELVRKLKALGYVGEETGAEPADGPSTRPAATGESSTGGRTAPPLAGRSDARDTTERRGGPGLIATLLGLWTCGLLLGAVCLPQRQVAWVFWRFLVLLAISASIAVAAFVTFGAVEAPAWVGPVVGVTVVAGGMAWLGALLRTGGQPLGPVAGRLGALVALAGVGLAAYWFAAQAGVLPTRFDSAQLAAVAAAAVVIGAGSLAAMLGHAYLTAKSMPIEPLRRIVGVYGLAVAAHGVCGGLVCWSLLVAQGVGSDPFQTAVVMMYVLGGLAAPVAFALMAWQAVAVRNTQSTTGIMYFAMVTNFAGTLALCFLLRSAGAIG